MNVSSSVNLMWFRRDLRTFDNKALYAACDAGVPVIALYVATPKQWKLHNNAGIQVDLIQRRLKVLEKELEHLNIPLLVESVATYNDVPSLFASLIEKYQIKHVFCNNEFSWNERQRDHMVANQLNAKQVLFSGFDDDCALIPNSIVTQHGDPYKVFTPFKNTWLKEFDNHPLCLIKPKALPFNQVTRSLVDSSNEFISFDYSEDDSSGWDVETDIIHDKLSDFCKEKLFYYKEQREEPSIDGTSGLSPYLTIGALSIRQCMNAIRNATQGANFQQKENVSTWLNELIWREFYRHLMIAYPRVSKGYSFHSWAENIEWNNNPDWFLRWKKGETGYPIVDAAMRQLEKTGWMHNRLRMIVASFLTKDLLLPWQLGEAWFMSKLIDGDHPSNNGGWQWSASTGTDAQPYFRIFNPTVQGQRFDLEGKYIRRWVKELREVPDKYIHTPDKWVHFDDLNYPKPIVEHKQARLLAIEVFKKAKGEIA
ncbi:deoxyribodipyrimidine photo-lyase [Vibrio sp. Of7-15]|nr:deoxyribodipyrimidine photo-lyase [Vibrio sp. Of7-15]MCG7496211.1 deoxyribodipyrimidine photo-lyase [Vibrio sp. Of7-15]